jgi:predicted flap endonuclease-1-like 5' DNA nuclease
MASLIDIEGIGKSYAAKFRAAGIASQEQLLEMGSTPKGREALAEKVDVSSKLILEWVNRADLNRIKGIGSEYADLLEAAGVDSVPELAQRNAENLYNRIKEIHTERKLIRRLPGLNRVSGWITQAKELPRVVQY